MFVHVFFVLYCIFYIVLYFYLFDIDIGDKDYENYMVSKIYYH